MMIMMMMMMRIMIVSRIVTRPGQTNLWKLCRIRPKHFNQKPFHHHCHHHHHCNRSQCPVFGEGYCWTAGPIYEQGHSHCCPLCTMLCALYIVHIYVLCICWFGFSCHWPSVGGFGRFLVLGVQNGAITFVCSPRRSEATAEPSAPRLPFSREKRP